MVIDSPIHKQTFLDSMRPPMFSTIIDSMQLADGLYCHNNITVRTETNTQIKVSVLIITCTPVLTKIVQSYFTCTNC